MSDPTRPLTQPLSEVQARLSEIPYAMGVTVPEARFRSIEAAVGLLRRIGITVMPSVECDKQWIEDPALKNAVRSGRNLCRADTGALQARRRVMELVELGRLIRSDMLEASGPRAEALRRRIDARCAETVAAGGGSHAALGRLEEHYPRKPPERPPTYQEALNALERCGLAVDTEQLRALPLSAVRINKRAELGYPVGRTGMDAEALSKTLRLAVQIKTTLSTAASKTAALDNMEAEHPSWFLAKAKAKYDVYKLNKLDSQLRLYNVVPGPLRLLMQTATQVLEERSTSVPYSNSTQGFPLVRGGGEELVGIMETRLGNSLTQTYLARGSGDIGRLEDMERRSWLGSTYVHCGDDSWLSLALAEEVRVYDADDPGVSMTVSVTHVALDCTAFDLTQHADTTEPVHDALRSVLEKVDGTAALIWHRLMRSRRTLLSGTVVGNVVHGGPSGMPLQSKVNDMLMEILLARISASYMRGEALVERNTTFAPDDLYFDTDFDSERLFRIVQREGEALGLKVRVDQMACDDREWSWQGPVSACPHGLDGIRLQLVEEAFRGALARSDPPFVYVGYEFHANPVPRAASPGELSALVAEPGRVWLRADVPRMIAQLPYPNGKFVTDTRLAKDRAILKGAGVLLAAGNLPCPRAYAYVRGLLARVTDDDADVIEEVLHSHAHAGLDLALDVRTARGLARVLEPASVERLWNERPSVNDWADEMPSQSPEGPTVSSLVVSGGGNLAEVLRAKRIAPGRPHVAVISLAQAGRMPPRIRPPAGAPTAPASIQRLRATRLVDVAREALAFGARHRKKMTKAEAALAEMAFGAESEPEDGDLWSLD